MYPSYYNKPLNTVTDEWVKLNVGGTIFLTRETTLTKYPMVLVKFGQRTFPSFNSSVPQHEPGAYIYIIDRNPKYFGPVLDFLRHGKLMLDQNVVVERILEEAEFFELPKLVSLIKENMKERKPVSKNINWIKLDVGGSIFSTTITTLARYPDSFLYRLCREDTDLITVKDESGAYLIERNPHYFAPVLDFIRHGKLVSDKNVALEGVQEEAEFFNLPQLVSLIQEKMRARKPISKDNNWIKLDVGGSVFSTTRTTLAKYPDSLLHRLCQEDADFKSDQDESVYFIERNPNYFAPVLDFIRHGKLVSDKNVALEGVQEEAEFFNLPQLVSLIQEKMRARKPISKDNNWIKLDVGGSVFSTTRTTLAKYPDSLLHRLCQEDADFKSDQDESVYFIERNPNYFAPVLDFIRHGKLVLEKNVAVQGVREEAEFFNLPVLVSLIEEKMKERKPLSKNNNLIKLNIGGTIFLTTRTTLARYPDSLLYSLCQEDAGFKTDEDESAAYFIERNPNYFTPVLDFLRYGELIMEKSMAEERILKEAEFFNLPKLVSLIEQNMKERKPVPKNNSWIKLT